MKKIETHYHVDLSTSEYDPLDIVQSAYDNRITIKMNEGRWRTKAETIAVLQEIIKEIRGME